jgi:hypothetical protein
LVYCVVCLSTGMNVVEVLVTEYVKLEDEMKVIYQRFKGLAGIQAYVLDILDEEPSNAINLHEVLTKLNLHFTDTAVEIRYKMNIAFNRIADIVIDKARMLKLKKNPYYIVIYQSFLPILKTYEDGIREYYENLRVATSTHLCFMHEFRLRITNTLESDVPL